MSLSPLQCANLAKRLRGDARAARLAGDYPRATVLYRMAATCQVQAVLPC